MMRAILYATLLLVSLFLNQAHSQTDQTASDPHGYEPGVYSVGFRLIEEQDHSRAVTGGLSHSAAYARPVRTYLWYPAEGTDDSPPMRFGRYASLADEDIWPVEIAGSLREELEYSGRALARSMGPQGFAALLQQPVLATEMAEALEGPFPLVVIGQGLYYESPVAFAALSEYLAGRGFVVATCPLVGTNSPLVRIDAQGLETQVRDLEFVIAQARRLSFVSQDRLGVFGFDMGGMAGLILAMRNKDVDAFVSVSSGILYQHPSGIPAGSPDYDPLRLRIPWLHSVPVAWTTQPQNSEAESLFETAVHSERYLLLTEGLGHVDYTSYALIDGRSEMYGYWEASEPAVVEGNKAVSRYILNFFDAFLKQDSRSLAFPSQDPQELFPGSGMTLEHRSASADSITYEEFVQAVIAGQAELAIAEVYSLRETDPDHVLLNETYLQRLVWSLRDTWGRAEDAMPVIEFMVELYPNSVAARRMLAKGYTDVEDYPAAIEVYIQLLAQDPDDDYIRSRLQWLQSQ